MKYQACFPEELLADEVVCFIANRHDVTPQQLLQYFFQKHLARSFTPAVTPISLESNEKEILKGLYDKLKNYDI